MKLVSREFVRDRTSLIIASSGLVLAVFNVIYILLQVKQLDFEIPVRFSQLGASPIELGDWFTLYDFAVFAIVASTINLILGLNLHKKNRPIAKSVLSVNVILMILLFIVIRAVLGLSPVS